MSQEIDSKEFYPMTRNVMFHGVFTRNKVALSGLVRSVLHLREEDVKDIILLSSTEPPKNSDGKTFILDVKVQLQNGTTINLEMQTNHDDNWANRSLSYLCRNYDSLNRGEKYDTVTPTIHIGFLGFTLFNDLNKFHSTYKLCDIEDLHVYSDNFILEVVQLKQSELASEEDKKYGIDRWARLFLATSREELYMIAENDTSMKEAAKTAILMNNDWEVRENILRSEIAEADIKRMKQTIEEQKSALSEKDVIISKKDAEIERLNALLKNR